MKTRDAAVIERNGVKTKEEKEPTPIKLIVPAPSMQSLTVDLLNTAPLLVRAWDSKTMQQLADKAKGCKTKKRENVDPEATMNAARYISTDGWDGFPAGAFRAAIIDAVACADIPKTDFSMTLAKKCGFFIKADGICRVSGRDLINIGNSKPEMYSVMQPTTGGGPYMSYRPIYRKWKATLNVSFNSSRIDAQGVLNLIAMAGYFIGIGEHRPTAKESRTGMNGLWEIVTKK